MTETNSVLSFDVVKRVTLPFIIIEPGDKRYLRFDTPIAADDSSFSERVRASKKDGEQQNEKPMDIAKVTDLQTNEQGRMVIHDTLKSNLNEAYPDNGYVNRLFQIQKSKERGGRGSRKYFTFDIVEIRLKTAEPEAGKAPAHVGAKK